jgi:hypothetical protein
MMTDTKKDKKTVDWQQKNQEDAARILRRAQSAASTPNNREDRSVPTDKPDLPPKANPIALRRLRKKIHEIYDDEEEEENDIVNLPFFDITLIDEETPHTSAYEQEQNSGLSETELLRITKEQQLTGKLNLIMDTALVAERAGLSSKITATDTQRATGAEFNLKKLRRQTLHDKIEKPLKLKGELPETELDKAVKGIKKARRIVGEEALEDFEAEDLPELNKENSPEEMADLILKKTGRKKEKKSLFELAQDLNRVQDKTETFTPSEQKE